MLNMIKTDLNFNWMVLSWFISFAVFYWLNISYWLKRLLGLKQSKFYKLIDCYPCQSFWITLFITFNIVTAIAVYFMAQILDRKL
jgi:hypothetical protein